MSQGAVPVHTGAVTTTRARVAGVVLVALVATVGAGYVFGFQDAGEPVPSEVAGERVQPVSDAPLVRLAVAGDTGTGDAAQAATVDEMLDQVEGQPPYDALVLLGDLVYEDGDADEVDSAVTEPFAPLTAQGTDLVPVLGNHDYESGEQTEQRPSGDVVDHGRRQQGLADIAPHEIEVHEHFGQDRNGRD